MSVFLRSDSPHWLIEFIHKGQRVRQSSGTPSKTLAKEIEAQLKRDLIGRLALGRIQSMTLLDAIERYQRTVIIPRGRPDAAKKDDWVFQSMVGTLGEKTKLEALTAPVLAKYRDDLLAKGRAPATANKYLAMLRAILRRACLEWGALAVVPAISLLKLNNARYRWLREEEEVRLLAECSPHLRDLATFLLDTGARLSEATGLTWPEVDLERSPRAVVKFMDTKSGKPRAVPLPRRTEEMLKRKREEAPEGQPFVFLYKPMGRGGRGIGRQEGVPKPYWNPHGAWDTACRRAKLPDLHIHDLRHTYASRLVMKGVPLLTVSKLLGHASIAMTMRYAHLASEAFDQAVGVLEAKGVE